MFVEVPWRLPAAARGRTLPPVATGSQQRWPGGRGAVANGSQL